MKLADWHFPTGGGMHFHHFLLGQDSGCHFHTLGAFWPFFGLAIMAVGQGTFHAFIAIFLGVGHIFGHFLVGWGTFLEKILVAWGMAIP